MHTLWNAKIKSKKQKAPDPNNEAVIYVKTKTNTDVETCYFVQASIYCTPG